MGDGYKSVIPAPHCSFFNVPDVETHSVRDTVENLGIRDDVLLATEVPYNAHSVQLEKNLGSLSKIQLPEDTANHPVTSHSEVSGSIFSNIVVLKSGSVIPEAVSCKQLGAHNTNVCVESSPITTSSESLVMSKVKQIGNGSAIKVNISVPKINVRNDSEKQNITDGYDYVSSLQSLRLQNQVKTKTCDLVSDDSSFLSLAEVANKQTSRVLEPIPAEENSHFSSLAKSASKHSKMMEPKLLEECSHFSSLAKLANRQLSEALEPQPSKSNCFSSLAQFANKHSLEEHDMSSEGNSFSSLAQLADRHKKVTKLQVSEDDNNFSSLSELANKHSKSEIQAKEQFLTLAELASQHQQVQKLDSISSLADLASHHFKVHGELKTSGSRHVKDSTQLQKAKPVSCSPNGYMNLKMCLPFSHENESSALAGQESVSPMVKRFGNNLAMDPKTLETGSRREGAELFLVSEMIGELVIDYGTSVDNSSDVTGVESSPVVRTLSEEENEIDWEIDLTHALMPPGSKTSQLSATSKPKVMDWKLQDMEQEVPVDVVVHETPEFILDFYANLKILNKKLSNCKKKSSPFGRTLCRKWKRVPTYYTVPRKQSLGKIVYFTFNTDSPDDTILKQLRRK
jgi:hypothetical protein